jgi:hypothetical protein
MTDLTELTARVERLEERLRKAHRLILALVTCGLGVFAVAAAMPDDGVIRARGLVLHDAGGTDRIFIGAPVPSGPGEGGDRISPMTGMILLDANRRERFGLGLQDSGWLVMGFDAAPGIGRGANRERLHLGVTPEGQGFIRYLDQDSGLAGRLLLNDENRVALELWRRDGNVAHRGALDIDGWRRLPDYPLTPGH